MTATTSEEATTAEEEVMIQQLLAGVVDRPTGVASMQQSLPPPTAKESQSDARDRLVLDAANNGPDGWTVSVSLREVDFVEQRQSDGKWNASISIVLSLLRIVDEIGTETHAHDETGTGRAEGLPSRQQAEELADRRAKASALRRLAKRFALSLEPAVLAAIDRQSHGMAPSTANASTFAQHSSWRNQYGGKGPARWSR